MKYAAAQDRDGNFQIIGSNEAFKLESTWTFVAGTTGAVGAHTLFTVTGNVLATIFGVCDTNLTEGGATTTIEAGIAGNTAGLLAQINATALDDGELWVDNTPATIGALPGMKALNDGSDIILTIGTNTVTAGAVDFYCLWRPLSSDGNITVTTPA
jgi:hypothetical protein